MGISPKLPKKDPTWAGVHKARVSATLWMIRRLINPIDDGQWWSSASALLEETDVEMRGAMHVPEDWKSRPEP